ncbi:hypothetical protein [Corynebacterium pacaense]|uniref:hypothetical protein n=1 Tax=Corynebacterium pacaense TaxID=1816684 RepID=UPI0009BA4E5E|nr:hypothetical protein [Corynebacterium pacaense]
MSARRIPQGQGDSTTGSESGTDYRVSYTLNQYQRGSMVLRFARPPAHRELLEELGKYGIAPASVTDLSAAPVPDPRQRNATVHGEVLNYGREQSPAKPRARRGYIGPVLGLALLAFIVTAATDDQSFERGRVLGSVITSGADFGERVEFCVNALSDIADGSPGPFEDRPSDFALHPANAAFLTGCLL